MGFINIEHASYNVDIVGKMTEKEFLNSQWVQDQWSAIEEEKSRIEKIKMIYKIISFEYRRQQAEK